MRMVCSPIGQKLREGEEDGDMSDTEKARKLLEEQIGSLPGKPLEISKDEVWKDFAKQLIDLE